MFCCSNLVNAVSDMLTVLIFSLSTFPAPLPCYQRSEHQPWGSFPSTFLLWCKSSVAKCTCQVFFSAPKHPKRKLYEYFFTPSSLSSFSIPGSMNVLHICLHFIPRNLGDPTSIHHREHLNRKPQKLRHMAHIGCAMCHISRFSKNSTSTSS